MNSNKKLVPFITLLVMPYLLIAAPPKVSNPYLDWMYNNILLVIGIIVIGIMLFHFMTYMDEVTDYYQAKFLKEHGVNLSTNNNDVKQSLFERLYNKSWNLVPISKEADIQLDHDYDGIHELDNSLPPWWLYLFYLTITIGIVYLYVYEVSDIGMTQEQEYLAEMELAKEQRIYALSLVKDMVNERNVTVITDLEELETGKGLFISYCAACHGQLGEGTVGPNLTDKYWIHGGGIKDLYKTIYYGVPDKGMIAWKSQMQPSTIQKVASYILTLQGTDPPNQKKPQGVEYIPSEDI